MSRRHPNARSAASLPRELRRTTVPPAVRAWVQRHTGQRVRRVARLPGASSAAVHRVWLGDGSSVVTRRYVWSGFIEAEPDAPAREVEMARFARANGVVVPEVLAVDLDGDDVGDGVPVILAAFARGRAIADPDPRAMADLAAAIHSVPADDVGHGYFPWYLDTTTAPPARTNTPDLWERAIRIWHDEMPTWRPTLIHRDFHPGNVLWLRARVSAVVDWANACRGPAGCDVATCRANLRRLGTPELADEFVAAYEAVTGTDLDPFWIMAEHLEFGPSHWTDETLAAAEPDLAAAVARLT